MSPDTVETRLRQLEGAVARLEQHMDDITNDIRDLAPTLTEVAKLQQDIKYMREALQACRQGIDDLKADIEESRRSREKAATDSRKWTAALATTILLGFLGLAVQIVLAVLA